MSTILCLVEDFDDICLIIYGDKTVGKTTILKRILFTLATNGKDVRFEDVFPENIKNETITQSNGTKTVTLENYFKLRCRQDCRIIFVECPLADIKSVDDIGTLIVKSMLGDKSHSNSGDRYDQFGFRVGSMIRDIVEKYYYKKNTRIVMYFDIQYNKKGDTSETGVYSYQTVLQKLNILIRYLRRETTGRGIGCIVEVSKSVLSGVKEIGRTWSIRVRELNQKQSFEMTTILKNYYIRKKSETESDRLWAYTYYEAAVAYVKDKLCYPSMIISHIGEKAVECSDGREITQAKGNAPIPISDTDVAPTLGNVGCISDLVKGKFDSKVVEQQLAIQNFINTSRATENDIRILYDCVSQNKFKQSIFAMESKESQILHKFGIANDATSSDVCIRTIYHREAISRLKKLNYGLK